ncbi:MAG TPA: phosphatidate cytidylyltransferase [Thermoanaerobaculia bacterium]|nr:phosphatidate cytidylyltransferase [Thermoanaerobaculia bacterium]
MSDQPPPQKTGRYARELTTLVAAPLLIWLCGWAPHGYFIAGMGLACTLGLYEFLVLGEKKGYPVQKSLSIALMWLILAAFLLPQLSVEVAVFAVLLILPATFVFTVRELDTALPATAVCVLGTLYLGMMGGTILRMRLDFGDVDGRHLMFFLFVVVWIGDAGAYYVGKTFGKTRLWPRVSPKKTVEGGLGGVATAILAAAVIHFTFFQNFPLVHALIAAALLSVTGVIGDLAESLWKRSADVKDSGALIPGHGGFLDRSDSILFTAPILYGYWFLLAHNFRLT